MTCHSDFRKAVEYTKPGAVVPINIETTTLLVNVLRQALVQPEREYTDVVVAEHADGTYTIQRIPLSKREWVGLTEEERADCWSSSAVQSAINIEAKLKEKNT